VASLSQGRTAAAQCGLFTYKSVPVIFEPPCSFVTSVLHFVRPRETTDFHKLGYLNVFRRCVKKMEVSLKSYKNNRYFTRSIITRVISRGGFTVKLMKFQLHF